MRRHWFAPTGSSPLANAVDGGDGHGLVGEDLIPATERLVGGDGDAAVFIASGDQFEKDAGFGLILVGVGDLVEVEAEKRAFRGKDRPPTSGRTCRASPRLLPERGRVAPPGAAAPDRWFWHKRRGGLPRSGHGR